MDKDLQQSRERAIREQRARSLIQGLIHTKKKLYQACMPKRALHS